MLNLEIQQTKDGWEVLFKRPSNGQTWSRRSMRLEKAIKKLLKTLRKEGTDWVTEWSAATSPSMKAMKKALPTEPIPVEESALKVAVKKTKVLAAANPAPEPAVTKDASKSAQKLKTVTPKKRDVSNVSS